MKIIGFIPLLPCTKQSSKGQEPPAKDFYLHFGKVISTIKSDSITLTKVKYGCLGGQINWSTNIKSIGNSIKVDFYSQRSKDRTKPSAELETMLITCFTVERKILKKNLEAEITKIKTRPVFIEAGFKFSLNQGNLKKEFTFRRGEGLYYLLRHNQIYESYFASRLPGHNIRFKLCLSDVVIESSYLFIYFSTRATKKWFLFGHNINL